MSRQPDIKTEEREAKRQTALVKALEFGIVGALEFQGIELVGFSINYDEFNCLLTVRAIVAGKRKVAFVGSDSIMNCLLKFDSEARRMTLSWRLDKYHEGLT